MILCEYLLFIIFWRGRERGNLINDDALWILLLDWAK